LQDAVELFQKCAAAVLFVAGRLALMKPGALLI
jgi:hypothetical protein